MQQYYIFVHVRLGWHDAGTYDKNIIEYYIFVHVRLGWHDAGGGSLELDSFLERILVIFLIFHERCIFKTIGEPYKLGSIGLYEFVKKIIDYYLYYLYILIFQRKKLHLYFLELSHNTRMIERWGTLWLPLLVWYNNNLASVANGYAAGDIHDGYAAGDIGSCNFSLQY
ncbi:hypothetical protein ACJX0J_008475 [Zea mays]